jgi:trans-aconitate methyltransferase
MSQQAGKEWNAKDYDQSYSFVWKYGADLIELLAPQPGERILDLGCGTGHLTARIAEMGAEVTGMDSSEEMVEKARGNYPNLSFERMDARSLPFAAEFDAVFSNAVLHWVKPPEQAVASIAKALRPGGRFVAEFGGKGNIKAIVDAVTESLHAAGVSNAGDLNPWYFPSIPEYSTLLERSGLETASAWLFDRLTPLEKGEAGMAGWLEMFGAAFLQAVPPERREAVIAEAEERMRPALFREGVWHADYRRLRVVAVRR